MNKPLRLAPVLAAVLALWLLPSSSSATTKALSTDGEATIYGFGDFSGRFVLSYAAIMKPAPSNRGASWLSINILARGNPSAVAVGLSRGDPNAASLRAFTAIVTVKGVQDYKLYAAECRPSCALVLRGDGKAINAYVNTVRIATWPRSSFTFQKAAVQLNGEVHVRDDTIDASLTPVQTVANGHPVHAPTCAFTTQGVWPGRQPNGALVFTGSFKPGAKVTFLDFPTRKPVDRCHRQ